MTTLTFPGKPCRNGHSGTRWRNGGCVACEMLHKGTVLCDGRETFIPRERHVVEISAIVSYGDKTESAVIVATLTSRGRVERREFLGEGTLAEIADALANIKRWVELNHARDPSADAIGKSAVGETLESGSSGEEALGVADSRGGK